MLRCMPVNPCVTACTPGAVPEGRPAGQLADLPVACRWPIDAYELLKGAVSQQRYLDKVNHSRGGRACRCWQYSGSQTAGWPARQPSGWVWPPTRSPGASSSLSRWLPLPQLHCRCLWSTSAMQISSAKQRTLQNSGQSVRGDAGGLPGGWVELWAREMLSSHDPSHQLLH